MKVSTAALRVALALALALALSGCSGGAKPQPRPTASRTPQLAPAFEKKAEPAEAVLSLVPQSADVITVTDWDEIRVQLGQPELTSESLVTDRTTFWERAAKEAPALAEGMLRADDSTYLLDYGFSQDDVDWEAHWTGPDGPGYALKLRDDLDLQQVRLAIRQGVGAIADGRIVEADHLVVHGTSDVDTWANEDGWDDLVSAPAEATYLRRGCIPLPEALGPDGTQEDVDAIAALKVVPDLDDLPGFAVAFGDHTATVRVEPGRIDDFDRIHLANDWPVPDFKHSFKQGVADPSSGRLGYEAPNPPKAAAVALLGELPFAVCNQITPIPAPTG
jgi:hypothetical protein